MANNMTGNPWVCDIPGVVTALHVYVRSFRWVAKSGAAGDDIVVIDNSGKTIFESVASGANFVDTIDVGIRVNGITISVIDNGKLFVYV